MKILSSHPYTKDYYEQGKAIGVSNYENYRWIPEKVFPYVESVLSKTSLPKGSTILDYGCAKGYMVKAFRDLGYISFGVDISEYAILNSNSWCSLHTEESLRSYDLILCKDVLEHMTMNDLDQIMQEFRKSKKIWIQVPLATEYGNYIAEESERDKTHIIRKDFQWWADYLGKHLQVVWKSNTIPGIRTKYDKCKALGIFLLEK